MNGRLRSALTNSLRTVYNATIRSRLPRKIGYFNGVAVRAPRLFDLTDHMPDYKAEQMDCIAAAVEDGDTVVNVGGGYGVSTVVAARRVGSSGRVVTFEPAAEVLEPLRETAEMNGVADRVELRHAAIGSPSHPKGSIEGADALPPSALPECDVLILDCDGAEAEIVPRLEIRPRDLVIESHPRYGVDTEALLSTLGDLGYEFPDRYFDGVGGTHHFVATTSPERYSNGRTDERDRSSV
jgi:hypothetical protein